MTKGALSARGTVKSPVGPCKPPATWFRPSRASSLLVGPRVPFSENSRQPDSISLDQPPDRETGGTGREEAEGYLQLHYPALPPAMRRGQQPCWAGGCGSVLPFSRPFFSTEFFFDTSQCSPGRQGDWSEVLTCAGHQAPQACSYAPLGAGIRDISRMMHLGRSISNPVAPQNPPGSK